MYRCKCGYRTRFKGDWENHLATTTDLGPHGEREQFAMVGVKRQLVGPGYGDVVPKVSLDTLEAIGREDPREGMGMLDMGGIGRPDRTRDHKGFEG